MKKKVINTLSKQLAFEKGISEHANKLIVQYPGLFKHASKHSEEYISIESYECTMNNIGTVICNPTYVYYNEKNKSLEFYKELIEPVCVIVQLVNKRELPVASVYPVTNRKISNRKYKELYDSHVITEDEFDERNKDTVFVPIG